MTEQNSLKQVLQSLVTSNESTLQGVVISDLPLKIQIVNDEKLILGERALIIPNHLTNYKMTIDISLGSTGDVDSKTKSDTSGHIHDLENFALTSVIATINNSLKTGEYVHLLALNKAKKYYILDRVVIL